jgi:hypothetical protein
LTPRGASRRAAGSREFSPARGCRRWLVGVRHPPSTPSGVGSMAGIVAASTAGARPLWRRASFAAHAVCRADVRNSKFAESQIVPILKDGEAGMVVTEACSKHDGRPATESAFPPPNRFTLRSHHALATRRQDRRFRC